MSLHGERRSFRLLAMAMAMAMALVGPLLLPACGGKPESPAEAPVPATPPVADHAGHGTVQKKADQETTPMSAAPGEGNVLTVSPERLQAIGVKFEVAALRPLDRIIRTVGRVEVN